MKGCETDFLDASNETGYLDENNGTGSLDGKRGFLDVSSLDSCVGGKDCGVQGGGQNMGDPSVDSLEPGDVKGDESAQGGYAHLD